MSQQRLQQLEERLDEANKLLAEVEQQIVAQNDPLKRAWLELEQSHLFRVIEQFEQWFKEIEAGKNVPDIGEISLQSNPKTASANPFNQMGIVTDQWFIGRKPQLRRIREALVQKNSLVLVGPSKMGKTSLLWQFLKIYQAEGRTVLQIDFKLPKPIQEHYAVLTRLLGKSGNTILELEKALQGRQVTLFIDEFELAVARGLDSEQLLAFKGLREAEGSGFQIIAASSKRVSQIYPGPFTHSIPYGFFAQELLRTFNEVEANELFDCYLGNSVHRFSPEKRQELFVLSGGHPFRLQRAAYRYYESLLDHDYNWREDYEVDISEY
ncbi:MAG: ATP-binding protein [Chloroflexota bacterium]